MPTFENIALQGGLTFQVEPLPLGGSIYQPSLGSVRYSTGSSFGNDFSMGSSDFTVEWFHKITDSNNGGIFWSYFYTELLPYTLDPTQARIIVRYDTTAIFNILIPDAWNVWDYFAITRENGICRLFRNGIQLGSDVSFGTDMQSSPTIFNLLSGSTRNFTGYLTNFNWVKGEALYTSNYSPPATPILPSAGTKLLLRATNAPNVFTDSSGYNKVPTSTGGATFSTETPFSP